MRTVLQRQTQMGDFEYIYVDTTKKPRWQLLMHQLTHPVAKRRIIIELHSEWGLPKGFFADYHRIRKLHEPLGCRVKLGTVLRHPLSFYLSWFNWRASNYMPLCQWDPPRDPQSRQLTGYSLPFVPVTLPPKQGGRRLKIPPEAPLSVLRHFDVVGFTERFDESLLLLGHASGMRHLGYARLADNQKPHHPRLAKELLTKMLSDVGTRSLSDSFDYENAGIGKFQPANTSASALPQYLREALLNPAKAAKAGGNDNMFMLGGSAGGSSTVDGGGSSSVFGNGGGGTAKAWSKGTLDAAAALDAESLKFVADRYDRQVKKEKADCNFYPCAGRLHKQGGVVDRQLCDGIPPEAIVQQMLAKTETDRVVHKAMVERFDKQMKELEGALASRGGVEAALTDVRAASLDVRRRRTEQIGTRREKLCGVRLCGNVVRSCVGCEPNPVPGLEPCWPSWEDQFSPDERKLWCKRTMTYPGYDEAEIKAKTYPKITQIPCWRTCWEKMVYKTTTQPPQPTCLDKDMPSAMEGTSPGPSCASREVHCSPGCTKEYKGTLKEFWADWESMRTPDALDALGITCPCGHGG